MGVEGRPPNKWVFGAFVSDFCPTKPEFRWKEAPLHHAVPAAVHVVDGFSQVINAAISDREGQEYGFVGWEVLVELRQPFEEPPAPRSACLLYTSPSPRDRG